MNGKNHPIEFEICIVSLSGGDSTEVTPVPIPNTVVKLLSADGTWRVTAWEIMSSPELKSDFYRNFRVI